MNYYYIVVYREYSGRFIKKKVTSYSDWVNCINDITSQLGINITDLISVAVDTNPPAED